VSLPFPLSNGLLSLEDRILVLAAVALDPSISSLESSPPPPWVICPRKSSVSPRTLFVISPDRRSGQVFDFFLPFP